ncbi:hypothetical protein BHE74_00043869 [Ensete ventricosum]|nr:hypothetical protein BHE74_00043869 [Ensete ventricosum]
MVEKGVVAATTAVAEGSAVVGEATEARQKQGRLERKATGVWSATEHGERIATTGLCGRGKWLEMVALGKGRREVRVGTRQWREEKEEGNNKSSIACGRGAATCMLSSCSGGRPRPGPSRRGDQVVVGAGNHPRPGRRVSCLQERVAAAYAGAASAALQEQGQ